MDQQAKDSGMRTVFKWVVKDKIEHERGGWWYAIMTALAVGLFIYSIFTANFLFAIMVILVVFIVIVKDYLPAKDMTVAITSRGILFGAAFYEYKDLKGFYIIYEPPQVKKLYIEFKGIRPDLSIDLMDNDPIAVRDYLLTMLTENLSKEDESTPDVLEKIMKL